MKTIGIIPARYNSTRLPGKPLKTICGKPMIQHVYERSLQAKAIDQVIVATDDQRIIDIVSDFGGTAMLTSEDHKNGSDRIAEIAAQIDCDFIVNIQGDEPLILPEIIDEITNELISNPDLPMSTGSYQVLDPELFENPNVVKVVSDKYGNALFFSRSLIPHPRDEKTFKVFEHIGVYAFRREFLLKYVNLESTPLSTTESLEQLRVLEHGYTIRVVETKFPYNALSVDTQEDLETVIAIMEGQSNQ